MNETRHFIMKGKESMIDHVKSINLLGCCFWRKKGKSLQIGDVCFLYLSGKGHNRIRYRLEVVELSCSRQDSICWKESFIPDNDCYKLIPTAKFYSGNALTLNDLEKVGVNRYTQFQYLDEDQINYINQYFDE